VIRWFLRSSEAGNQGLLLQSSRCDPVQADSMSRLTSAHTSACETKVQLFTVQHIHSPSKKQLPKKFWSFQKPQYIYYTKFYTLILYYTCSCAKLCCFKHNNLNLTILTLTKIVRMHRIFAPALTGTASGHFWQISQIWPQQNFWPHLAHFSTEACWLFTARSNETNQHLTDTTHSHW